MFDVLKTTRSGRQMLRTASKTLGSASVVAALIGCAGGLGVAQTAGRLDTTFGVGGIVSTNPTLIGGNPNAPGGGITGTLNASEQSNGDIVMAGTASASVDGATSFALARFTANGQLDKTFGIFSTLSALLLPPNGQILVAGFTTGANTDAPGESVPVRHNSNGSLDTRLATGGIAEAISAAGSRSALTQLPNKFLPGRERRGFSRVLLHWSAAPLECCTPW